MGKSKSKKCSVYNRIISSHLVCMMKDKSLIVAVVPFGLEDVGNAPAEGLEESQVQKTIRFKKVYIDLISK